MRRRGLARVRPSLERDHMPEEHQHEGPRYTVRWLVSPRHRLEITSSLVTGIASLIRAGEVTLALEAMRTPDPMPHIIRWDIRETQSGQARRIAFDEFDRGDRFDPDTMAKVDVYFKRTYDAGPLAGLPDELRSKVRPSGLTFGCFSAGSRVLLGRVALASAVAHLRCFGVKGVRSGAALLFHNADQIQGLLHVSAYERQATDPLNDRVVFQTRIWPDEPDSDVDRRRVNDERLALVRALRAAFGTPDHIGLIHGDFAAQTAPHDLLSRKVSRAEYAHQLRTSLIAVNSHGLDGSGGFKIGESLAAGCALVSQPFRFEFSEPLLPGVHYLPFETPEECVAQCRRLLHDRSLANRIRKDNRDYYFRNIEPRVHARTLLRRAFASE